MNRYDIVFIGHLGTGIIVPFEGSPFVEQGSPVLFAPIAASCLGKRIAAVTKISESEEYLLEPLKAAGIDLFVQPGEIARYRVVFPTANVDQRQAFLIKGGEHFAISDIPPFEAVSDPPLLHGRPRVSVGLDASTEGTRIPFVSGYAELRAPGGR